jgi:hypothetical protein
MLQTESAGASGAFGVLVGERQSQARLRGHCRRVAHAGQGRLEGTLTPCQCPIRLRQLEVIVSLPLSQ